MGVIELRSESGTAQVSGGALPAACARRDQFERNSSTAVVLGQVDHTAGASANSLVELKAVIDLTTGQLVELIDDALDGDFLQDARDPFE